MEKIKKFNDTIYPVGTKVFKKSCKPFLSGNVVNTVKGIVDSPYKMKDGVPVKAYTFEEDDSIVECLICYKIEV
jgi:hypothetical protein